MALGVDLRRLLVVRPKEPGRISWTACQLARSGAFAIVVVDFTHTGVRLSLADAQKLAEAARKGGTLLLILTAPDAPGEGLLRLLVRPSPPAAPMLENRERHEMTVLGDGRVLVTGGWGASFNGNAEIYSPALGTWTAANVLRGRAGHTATRLPNGTVFLSGGYGTNNSDATSNAEIYNPVANTSASPLPIGGSNAPIPNP